MKYSYILVLLLIISSCKKDDDVEMPATADQLTFIWQGFYHDWTYNHRVNRMGDWISDVDYSNGFKGNFNHSAASGIGADILSYTTFATALRTRADIKFASGVESAVLKGVEGSIASVQVPVRVVLEDHLEVAEVLLNGFDMYSRPVGSNDLIGDGQADKLFHFETRFDDVTISFDGSKTVVDFQIYIALGGDCKSPECSSGPVNDFFDYQVAIAYQVIAGQSNTLHFTPDPSTNTYDWERPMNGNENEIQREDYTLKDVVIPGDAGFNIGVAGISSLYFQTEKGFGGFDGTSLQYPHMLNFDVAIPKSSYNSSTGTMTLDSDLFFKNWTAPVPIVSFGGGGSVSFEMGLQLIQIADSDALVESLEYSNQIIWLTNPFNPSPPTIGASIFSLPVDLVLE